jgi:hypothetical protein
MYKREELSANWTKQHNENLYEPYPSINVISDQMKVDEMGGN